MILKSLVKNSVNNFNIRNVRTTEVISSSASANLAPLKQDTISFTSKKIITFENADFKNKFSHNDYKTVKQIAEFAQKTGMRVYLVGGIVRDMLLGMPANDLDFLIEGDAVEFTKKFNEEYPDTQIEYLKDDFGTAKLRINGSDIDIASTREESYIRKAIPNVKNIGCSMDKDVKRRDFTINSMALKLKTNKAGEVQFVPVDIAGGLDDLNNGIIRATYQDSFNDDPTRIIRGLKFRLRYNFKYDEKTKQMQEKYLANPSIEEISLSRVDTTLRKLFTNKKMAPKAFDAIIDEKIYRLFAPEILAQSGWGSRIQKACEIFDIDNIANVYMKILDNKIVFEAQNLNDSYEKSTNYDIYKTFYRTSKENLAIYYAVTNDENAIKFYNELKDKAPLLKGEDIIRMGIKPGKELGLILDKLLKAKLNGNDLQTIEDEIKYAEDLIKG